MKYRSLLSLGFVLVLTVFSCQEKSKPKIISNNFDHTSRAAWQKPEIVIKKLGEISDKVIADIGAGTGYFSFRFALKSKKTIAIDIDKDMLELMDLFASNLPVDIQSKFETRLAEGNDPNIKPKEVDIIVIINTMTYIDDRLAYLEKLKPALKEDGQLLIVNFKEFNNSLESPPSKSRISFSTMSSEILEADYKITHTDTTALDHQYIIIAKI